ncbi:MULTISPECIES: hypothetical protein [Bacillus]|uniref:Uncharacterized protein n=1 Tax=Bacillus mycoides TaxID=1405 RepID=A0A3D9UBC2_BACMY|nr:MULTISPECIES: hypothetical protein [Bacillus]MBK5473053.1 hypothetical protein [Bacillus sp. TH19]QWG49350.1 hypothetical protein EXW37_05620 [Bacillus mycoides]QWH33155.1 hypothetical protein EXW28_05620 [Bacillus mycoides]RBP27932.1 hypothetical protein DET63_1056 [Bacillus sp. DB-2]REF25230.1 hypothetical protein DET55_12581 [Bacillus mycoides]
MFSFLLGLISGILESSGLDSGLNTRKIDRNIKCLQNYEWFQQIYNDTKYRKLFFTNYKVRSYLQSTIRVKLIIRNEKNRQKFYAVLDNQIKRDKK